MDSKNHISFWSSSLFILTSILILSLTSAFVLFYFLESFAEIENKGLKLGGAAACFVVIFGLLRNTYFKLTKYINSKNKEALEKEVAILERQLEETRKSSFEDFSAPNNYQVEISQDFEFAICYPTNWEFSLSPQSTLYGLFIDSESSEVLGFKRNVNVIVINVDTEDFDLKKEVAKGRSPSLKFMSNAQFVSEESFLLHGNKAVKQIINYHPANDQPMTSCAVYVMNPKGNRLFQITYTTTRKDFESGAKVFDDILSTFRSK